MSNQILISPSVDGSSIPRRKRRPALIGAALLVLCLFGAVASARLQKRGDAVRFSQDAVDSKPVVNTVLSTAAPATVDLVLPGNTEAVVVADIYAQAAGYVTARRADIGDRVHTGQLLATIESPELDQEEARARATLEQSRAAWQQAQANQIHAEQSVLEARAHLEQSEANETLAGVTAERWTHLVQKGVLPRQEGDERQFAFNARKADAAAARAGISTAQASVSAMQSSVVAAAADIRANQANVARLEKLVSFERVVAPFDGIITERQVERGDLISSGGVSGGRKLFAIAQPNVLRVQVKVPQTFAPDLQPGQDAQLSVHERPGRAFLGKVVRTANALNTSSRTLLVEVQVDNRDAALLPGMFSEVKFSLVRAHTATLIPADALIANAQGTRVAAVDGSGRIHFHNVDIARDLGTQIEIAAGLEPNQSVILNPGEMLTEGQQVQRQ